MTMDLRAMAKDIEEVCRSKGWYDTPVSFGLAMALLHSEVSEAFEAYRQWGMKDATQTMALGRGDDGRDLLIPSSALKPEGVGSEFADILIRLLDYVSRFDPKGDFYDTVADYSDVAVYMLSDSFAENINMVHNTISRTSVSHQTSDPISGHLADVYLELVQMSKEYGIDLEAEYKRKHAYNKTRAYRHGGKRF